MRRSVGELKKLAATVYGGLTRGQRAVLVVAIVAGVVVRVLALDRLPGIDGDEAWYGVNVHLLLDREPILLRTGVGNVLSPLHSGLLIGLEAVNGPSFALLRLPSAFWGCMAVMLSYPMLAPLTGVRAAITTTALLAASPAAVSQARRGWDPSATVLLSLLVSAFAMLNRPWLCGFSFLLSLAVHPTNVFLAPIAASQWGPTAVEWYRAASESQRRRMLRIAVIVLPFVAVGGFYVARTLAHAGFAPSIEIAIERLISLSAWQALGVGVVGLFSGITSAAIAGPPPFMLRLGASAIVFAAFTLAGVGSWLGGRERSALQMAWLSGGIVVSVLAFHVVAGPRALEPGVERYAMFLVVPLTIFCACGVNRLGRGANLTAAVLCSMLAAVLAFGYFVPLAMRGGDGYPMYRTGAVEPKLAAFEFLSMHSRDAEVVAIFADDWWLYWPLRYLAWHDRRMHVEVLGNYDSWPMPPGAKARPYPHPPDRVYAVVFSHGTQWARLRNEALQLFTATDPLGRPIVDVMTVPPDSYERLRDVMPWQSRQ